jgi:hypothetical protein
MHISVPYFLIQIHKKPSSFQRIQNLTFVTFLLGEKRKVKKTHNLGVIFKDGFRKV